MKCKFNNCNKSATVIGNCKYCKQNYCNNHRIVEQHCCTELKTCRDEALKKHVEFLYKSKCVGSKIQPI